MRSELSRERKIIKLRFRAVLIAKRKRKDESKENSKFKTKLKFQI